MCLMWTDACVVAADGVGAAGGCGGGDRGCVAGQGAGVGVSAGRGVGGSAGVDGAGLAAGGWRPTPGRSSRRSRGWCTSWRSTRRRRRRRARPSGTAVWSARSAGGTVRRVWVKVPRCRRSNSRRNDGEVDLDLVQPAGVQRGVHDDGGVPRGGDAVDGGLAAVRRAVVERARGRQQSTTMANRTVSAGANALYDRHQSP